MTDDTTLRARIDVLEAEAEVLQDKVNALTDIVQAQGVAWQHVRDLLNSTHADSKRRISDLTYIARAQGEAWRQAYTKRSPRDP